jgi:hypothetical protein
VGAEEEGAAEEADWAVVGMEAAEMAEAVPVGEELEEAGLEEVEAQ